MLKMVECVSVIVVKGHSYNERKPAADRSIVSDLLQGICFTYTILTYFGLCYTSCGTLAGTTYGS